MCKLNPRTHQKYYDQVGIITEMQDVSMKKNANRSIFITPYKLTFKWIKDFNIKPDILCLIKESLECIDTGDNFLKRTSILQTLRPTIKWDLMKLKRFCNTKDTVNKTKDQSTEWEKIFINFMSGRGLMSKIYKNSRS